ncbi:MAG: DUF2752 domain-containing protein [Gemmataceae bacterium]
MTGGFFMLWGLKVFPPNEQSFYPRCQLHSLTGLHCPGCGLTRSVHSLLNGELKQAVSYNLLAIVVVPVLAVAMIRSLWSWMWEKPFKPSKRNWTWMPITIGSIMVLFGILRNLPYEPFRWLAPHEITTNDVNVDSTSPSTNTQP